MAHLPQVFLFVCPRINILLCSLTYVSVMRSMTQSSADTSSIASFPPSATPPPSHVLNPVPISHTSHPTHRDTLASSQPQLPPLPQHSFFDIANDSILFSPQSKHHITRAIQMVGPIRRLNATLALLNNSFIFAIWRVFQTI